MRLSTKISRVFVGATTFSINTHGITVSTVYSAVMPIVVAPLSLLIQKEEGYNPTPKSFFIFIKMKISIKKGSNIGGLT